MSCAFSCVRSIHAGQPPSTLSSQLPFSSILCYSALEQLSVCTYPVSLEAVLATEEAVLDVKLQACRALQRSSLVIAA